MAGGTKAALQRQRHHERVVPPAAHRVKAVWPDAETTSGLRKRLKEHDLAEVIKYDEQARTLQVDEMAAVLELHGVETVGDFGEALEDRDRGRCCGRTWTG